MNLQSFGEANEKILFTQRIQLVCFYLFMREEKSNTGERLRRDIKREEVRKTKNSNTTLLILVNSFLGAFGFTVEVLFFETLRSNLTLKGPPPHLCRSF